MLSDTVKVKGFVTAQLFENDKLIHTIGQHNLVVDTGKNLLARRVGYAGEPIINQVSIGSGTSTPLASDTKMGSETATNGVLFTEIEENNIIVFIATFSEGVGTGIIREVGLFAENDTMVSRSLFSKAFNKGPSQFLNVSWKLQLA